MNIRNKYIVFFTLFIFCVCLSIVFVNAAPLQNPSDVLTPMSEMGNAAGFDNTGSVDAQKLPSMIANIIKVFLTFLGIIFTVLIIYGGYIWMTAGGSEEKVQKAKDTIQRAVIGFVIVVSAYAITYFVFRSMSGGGDTNVGLILF